MKKHLTLTKKGFTIIEVVLVLAIGAMIMMMVFIAVPGLQRNQRDTQRGETDLTKLYNQLVNYQSNNRGRLPSSATGTTATNIRVAATYDGGTSDDESASTSTTVTKNGITLQGTGDGAAAWVKFYSNYLLAGSDDFSDPQGVPYSLHIVNCGNTSGQECDTQRTDATFANDNAENNPGDDTEAQNYTILINLGATCDGETAFGTTGNRKFAVLYRYEGGGTFCQSN